MKACWCVYIGPDHSFSYTPSETSSDRGAWPGHDTVLPGMGRTEPNWAASQKCLEVNLQNGQNLEKKTKYFSLFCFFFKTYQCAHDVFFFSKDQTNQKCFSLGLSETSLIGPKWWCFVVRSFIFLRLATRSFGINQKMLSIPCPFVVWWSLPAFLPLGLSCCGTSAFSGLVPSRQQLLQDYRSQCFWRLSA